MRMHMCMHTHACTCAHTHAHPCAHTAACVAAAREPAGCETKPCSRGLRQLGTTTLPSLEGKDRTAARERAGDKRMAAMRKTCCSLIELEEVGEGSRYLLQLPML